MGNPYESDYFYGGFRDAGQGSPNPLDIVYDPSQSSRASALPPSALFGPQELNAFFSRFRDETRTAPFFVKKPAFLERPFFSKTVIGSDTQAVGVGATVALLNFVIDDRHRGIITTIGVEVDDLSIVNSGLVGFFFADTSTNPTVQENTKLPFANPADSSGIFLNNGKLAFVPGTVSQPYDLLSSGLWLFVKGPKSFSLYATLDGGAANAVNIRALVGLYEYWTPKAGEFESADFQV